MISQLTGTVVHIDPKYIILDVQGVGYRVFTTSDIMSKLSKEKTGNKSAQSNLRKNDKESTGIDAEGKKVTIWTYLAVRENAMDIYGFLSLAELNFFELLITISGIGPKTALSILNLASIHTLETAIQTGDTFHITKVSGIGNKIAEKIVRELKDKIEKVSHLSRSESEKDAMRSAMKNDSDVLLALQSLGYSQNESREALKKLPKEIIETNGKVREALKILGK